MKDYGKLFKKFRESRGLVLKDIAKLGVSVSHISRFERENTDLTISKFMSALNAINMPIDEFMYAANDFQRDEFNEILEKISLFVSARNVSGMEKLLISQVEKIEKRETFYTLNTILIKIRLQDLSDKSYYDESDIQYFIRLPILCRILGLLRTTVICEYCRCIESSNNDAFIKRNV